MRGQQAHGTRAISSPHAVAEKTNPHLACPRSALPFLRRAQPEKIKRDLGLRHETNPGGAGLAVRETRNGGVIETGVAAIGRGAGYPVGSNDRIIRQSLSSNRVAALERRANVVLRRDHAVASGSNAAAAISKPLLIEAGRPLQVSP